jgi:deazaflavin-dependent oxidoreductase (nitroreductase family)
MSAQMNEFNRKVIDEFRSNKGEVGGQFKGMPILLLTTTGAKTGKSFTKPLAYTTDGNRIVLIASFAGSPHHPAWFVNLEKNPTVTVEIGADRYQAKAIVTAGTERKRLFEAQAAKMPIFNDYQKKTAREIPVVVLDRIN